MQYLQEQPNGKRKPVPEETYMQHKLMEGFIQIIATGTVIVYRMAVMGSRPREHAPRMGGMHRLNTFYSSGKADHNTVRVRNRERNQGLMNN